MDADEILRAMQNSWDAGDSACYAALFAEEAVFIDVLGRIQRGRAVIASEHQKLFDSIYRGSRFRGRIEHREDLGNGVVVLNTVSELSVPDGPRAGVTPAVQTMVLVDGLIAYFHNTLRTRLSEFAHHDSTLAALSPLDWTRD
ncbi:SgcJ/EcaC family oxidoreductase [Nocardia terpenica]|uniref:SgcJ/EcaC family oxidoreductase n=1 Tax=Nocardia terpenica TaxID=455432 RepID=UPI0018951209|nr:SgcJ/EcaC family oxidoreductase [Nocardia terpenica]MBF6060441.1 SgcJ/EcaC family oxidoreductase [Nocardia terpenica]MBF6103701.1 SgcJ/EcaC family oxidoreductase [Nocardia terpenica]MBF6111925.1 SgcJ/EcaC family oxidoreductase [Nocardia terpenica]MBF6117922.1 SgcJ/EcaC family oxidoreductase [Nocardia terpenica]MBF6155352.1 SgcJ/EcaC family oxidoreductase [Nocardia terpenica]